MANLENNHDRIEALSRLMDRLCAPDLMLPEATVLRARLSTLLEEQAAVDSRPPSSLPSPAPGPSPVAQRVRPRTHLATSRLRSEKGRPGLRSPLAIPCACLSG